MADDRFRTQSDERGDVAAQLGDAGFADAVEVGRGDFGVVYRCAQVELDRVVAVKVLTEMLEESRPRFVRAQRALGRLTGHPHVVAVLQVGETTGGFPFLVMPYYRRGSVQARTGRFGGLPVAEVLGLGVKLAGALESAHRLGIVHRDVKPGNVLVTDYGEPALADFGIAHVSGGFRTAAGVISGTPAFTAPEVLGGEAPSAAGDVYGLGATLFCALTGHAAFQRRSGERLVTQFVRVANDPVPDLRERGFPDDVAAVVQGAMSREPGERSSAVELGRQLQDLQARRGLVVDEMAVWDADADAAGEEASRSSGRARLSVESASGGPVGGVAWPLGSCVGRGAELARLQELVSGSRLVTVTGVGGVGKTTLAVHAARALQADFPGGVWLVELGDLRQGALLDEVVAAAVGVRDQSGRPLTEVVVEFLATRQALVVLDNCEHLLDAAARLVQTVLGGCAGVRIMATSRELLGVAGESVLALTPLAYPNVQGEPTVSGLADYGAVELFAQRADAAVGGFELGAHNAAAVARICSRLEGLPLAIELAAARLQVMSAQQIAEGLSDRYRFLTRGRRGAPQRQQTLALSVGWSYELCTPVEQQVWGRLSVFAGSFELAAAQEVCGEGLSDEQVLDAVSALVEKSVLTRTEHDDTVRFRLLETLREYGQVRIEHSEQYAVLQRRHADWYRRLGVDAGTQWFGPHQVQWLRRIMAEMPNIREALQFSLLDAPSKALQIIVAMRPFWFGMLTEGRRWVGLALSATTPGPTAARIHALYTAAAIADMQRDLPAASTRIVEARELLQELTDPLAHGLIDFVDGFASLLSGDLQRARDCFERALAATDDFEVQAPSMIFMGWLLEMSGDADQSLSWFENALALAESRGELLYRARALASVGAARWRQGQPAHAQQLLRQSLQHAQLFNDAWTSAQLLEILAWIAESNNHPRRAVTLMAAAAAISRALGAPLPIFVPVGGFHDECDRRAREQLDADEFQAAWHYGGSLAFDQAIAFALNDDD